MSLKDQKAYPEGVPGMALGGSDDPYWGRPVDGLDEVPLSVRRTMESETNNRNMDISVQDLKLGALLRYHLRDWLVIIFCIIADVILNVIHPFNQFVSIPMFDNSYYIYPHKKNTVPIWTVPIIAIGIPLAVFSGYLCVRRNTRDFHQALLGLLTAVGVTAVFTDAIKDGVGRPRPDFFYRCFPDGVIAYTHDTYLQVQCTGDPAVIREGFKSFPSGHTSWSFAGLGYLSFYLAGKLTLFDTRGFTSRILIVFFPLLLASLVAVSRVSDYWHHWQDVTVGGLLGLSIAYFSYKQHFPSFADKTAGYPFPHIPKSSSQPLSTHNNAAAWGSDIAGPPRANGGSYDLESAQM